LNVKTKSLNVDLIVAEGNAEALGQMLVLYGEAGTVNWVVSFF